MSELTSLIKDFLNIRDKCKHQAINLIPIADFLDRKDRFLVASFCKECKDYTWREMEKVGWGEEFLSKLEKDKYKVYLTPEDLALYTKKYLSRDNPTKI